MKPSTNRVLSHQRLVSTGSADVQTFTVPNGTSHILIAVETVNARVTFDGSTPTTTNGLPYQADQMPVFVPVGQGCLIKFVSTAGNSAVNLAYCQ